MSTLVITSGLRACARARAVLALAASMAVLLSAASGAAQTWSGSQEAPLLFQIVGIDRTGEPGFPYGREDVAGDGLATFAEDEAGSDLRSLYADADASRLWLRAYLARASAPSMSLRVFFFIDSDARDNTGGPAHGSELDEALADDPTSGGYERAVSVGGDGAILGVFSWSSGPGRWSEDTNYRPADVRAELGLGPDPLEIGSAQHGYAQLELTHALSGLSQSCGGTLFVRLLNELSATRTLADDAPDELACQAETDDNGDPIVLSPDTCSSDAQCPGESVCRDGVCLIAYGCAGNPDCPSGYSCEGGICVKVVSGSCEDAADCDGLVCDGGRCVACAASGARACASGLACAPDGTCRDADGSAGGGGGELSGPGKVRGGAFSCAAGGSPARASAWTLVALVLSLLVRARKRRRSPARAASCSRADPRASTRAREEAP
jgi:hypothetical protein